MQTTKTLLLLLLCCSTTTAPFEQALNDSLVLAKLSAAAADNSSTATIITNLADINGPRLLGTGNYFAAAAWAKQALKNYGTDTAWFQPFDEQYRGWGIRSFNVEMTTRCTCILTHTRKLIPTVPLAPFQVKWFYWTI